MNLQLKSEDVDLVFFEKALKFNTNKVLTSTPSKSSNFDTLSIQMVVLQMVAKF
jgi:hypothetical protein